jgi:hypothetical protein
VRIDSVRVDAERAGELFDDHVIDEVAEIVVVVGSG